MSPAPRRSTPGNPAPRRPTEDWLEHVLAALRGRLDALALPDAPYGHLAREIELLERSHARSAEADRIRSHVEWALGLPWPGSPRAETRQPFGRVRCRLSRSHVGLEDVKRRIFEILAIRRLGGGSRGTVLCFLGPPGAGKSSMARSVAEALGRPFLTIPLGAVVHERELVGVTRRRDGASPGAILAGLHRTGAPDPVILLDEIDKISLGGEGTAAGALLHLLDPEHNAEFLDHYLGVPFDLSSCLFLATANDLGELPDALVDRMEVLPFHGYSETEKIRIARAHLLPRAHAHAGIERGQLRLSAGALRRLVRGYTEEAGVRHLQRMLVALARKAAVDIVTGGPGLAVKQADLPDLLGPRTVEEEPRLSRPAHGVATGLAWTSVGGSLLPTEAIRMPGSGRLILTGQIGEVMRESVQTAISYLRTCFASFGLPPDHLDQLDLHIHFPSAATPKDGPSAGIAVATALAGLLTGRPTRHDVALTGELSLHGAVLPVGGLREKLLAAIRCGIPEVVLPARNAEDARRLPADIVGRLVLHHVETAREVFDLTLLPPSARATPAPGSLPGRRRVARQARPGPRGS